MSLAGKVVLITGGGEGNTTGANTNATLGTTASGFVAISGRRVPIYVIAIAPPSAARVSVGFNRLTRIFPLPELTSREIVGKVVMPAAILCCWMPAMKVSPAPTPR